MNQTGKAFVLDLEGKTVKEIPISGDLAEQLCGGEWESEPIAYDLSSTQIAELLQGANDLTPEVREAWAKVAKEGGGLFIVP